MLLFYFIYNDAVLSEAVISWVMNYLCYNADSLAYSMSMQESPNVVFADICYTIHGLISVSKRHNNLQTIQVNIHLHIYVLIFWIFMFLVQHIHYPYCYCITNFDNLHIVVLSSKQQCCNWWCYAIHNKLFSTADTCDNITKQNTWKFTPLSLNVFSWVCTVYLISSLAAHFLITPPSVHVL